MDINKKHNVVVLDNNDILPNRFQPRKKFSEEELLELTESIKKYGVLEPIIVRPLSDKYELVAGERRYKANVLAGNDTIPAIIKDLNDSECSEIAIIENLQRKNLSAIEEALSYKRAIDLGYATQQQLAEKVGKSQSYVANKIRLLKLSDEVQDALLDNKISERHARSLLRLNSIQNQNKLLDRIINERLTVRRTDEEIDKMNNNEIKTTPVSDIFGNNKSENDVFTFGPESDTNNNLMNFDLNGNPIVNDNSNDSDDSSSSAPQFNIFSENNGLNDVKVQQEPAAVAPQPFNMFEAPAAPSVPEAQATVAPQPFNMFETSEAPSMPQTPIFNSNQTDSTISEFKKPDPIIVTDYSKQYDPVMPDQGPKEPDIDMKTIINLIRQCSDTIEKCGYKIDTEEYDLENMYQVVFKIDKM